MSKNTLYGNLLCPLQQVELKYPKILKNKKHNIKHQAYASFYKI